MHQINLNLLRNSTIEKNSNAMFKKKIRKNCSYSKFKKKCSHAKFKTNCDYIHSHK